MHTGAGAHRHNPGNIVLENFHPGHMVLEKDTIEARRIFPTRIPLAPSLSFLQITCSFYHSLPTSFISKSSWSIMHMFANSHACQLEQRQNYTKNTTFHYEKSSICTCRSLHMYLQKNNSKKLHFLMAVAQ